MVAPSAETARERRRAAAAISAFAFYVLLGFLRFHAVWVDPGRVTYGGQDASVFIWFLGWTEHALASGTNPLFSHLLAAPTGVNLMWNTPVTLLGLVVAPITSAAGPIVSYNLLLTISMPFSAFAAYLALRRFAPNWPSVVGGLLYGFGPVLIGMSQGHLHLEMAIFPPILLMLLDDLVVRRRHPRRSAVLLGLASAGQLLVSSEVLVTGALIAGIGLVLLALLRPARVRLTAPAAARSIALAACVAAPLAAFPLAVAFLGGQRPRGPLQPPGRAVSDLLTPVVPTPLQAISPAALDRVSRHFTGGPVEVGGYLGVPLIMLLAVIVWRRRRDLVVTWAASTAGIAALLSLGARLHVNGRTTSIRLPWAALQRLPNLDSVLPARLALFVGLFAALILARGLSEFSTRRAPIGLLIAGIALAPLVPHPLGKPAAVAAPPYFSGPEVQQLPQNSLALAIPAPAPGQPQAMVWQAVANYRFRLIGCYCLVPGANGRASSFVPPGPFTAAIQQIVQGQPEVSLDSAAVTADLQHLAPDVVLLGPAPHQDRLLARLTQLLGPPQQATGLVTAWRLNHPILSRNSTIRR